MYSNRHQHLEASPLCCSCCCEEDIRNRFVYGHELSTGEMERNFKLLNCCVLCDGCSDKEDVAVNHHHIQRKYELHETKAHTASNSENKRQAGCAQSIFVRVSALKACTNHAMSHQAIHVDLLDQWDFIDRRSFHGLRAPSS